MKRRLALSLAALLLLGCLTPALAAEGDAELSLYQQYGPWGEWPQEQKDAAEETWTDGQWDDYWTEYDAQMWAALNRYNEDYDRWSYARFGDPWDEYLRVEKEEMGMPYPDGINVSLNGVNWFQCQGQFFDSNRYKITTVTGEKSVSTAWPPY